MGILTIITTIITVMILDVILLLIAFYHHNLHKTEVGNQEPVEDVALNANYTILSLALP